MVWGNKKEFMNKEKRKSLTLRSRLKSKFLKGKSAFSREAYNKQRSYCTRLIRESKIKCLANFTFKIPINGNLSLWEKID